MKLRFAKGKQKYTRYIAPTICTQEHRPGKRGESEGVQSLSQSLGNH